MHAKLYGIGVGPGDPELLTLKGLRLIREASHLYVPATRPGHSYAAAIVVDHLTAEQQVIELVCPPLRDRAAIEARWCELARTVAQQLEAGGTGVFLCEGDPSLYSTFQYLAAALRRDHPWLALETVPGVSSVNAAAALAEMPLALWDERLTVLPGVHDSAIDSALQATGSVALLKPGRAIDAALAMAAGMGHVQAALVRRAGRPEQEVLFDPSAMRAAANDYFSLLLLRRTAP